MMLKFFKNTLKNNALFFRYVKMNFLSHSVLAFLILWSFIALILMQALGNSIYSYNKRNLERVATPLVIINFGMTEKMGSGIVPGRKILPKEDFQQKLKNIFPQILDSTVVKTQSFSSIEYQNKRFNIPILGVEPQIYSFENEQIFSGGRGINSVDIKNKEHVTVLSTNVAKQLFSNPKKGVGESVYIDGIPFTVIGVLDSSNLNFYYNGFNAMIPLSVSEAMWGENLKQYYLILLNNKASIKNFQQNLNHFLAKELNFVPDDENAMQVFSYTQYHYKFEVIVLFLAISLYFISFILSYINFIGAKVNLEQSIENRAPELYLYKIIGFDTKTVFYKIFVPYCFFYGMLTIGAVFIANMIINIIKDSTLTPAWATYMEMSIFNLFFIILTYFLLCLTTFNYFKKIGNHGTIH